MWVLKFARRCELPDGTLKFSIEILALPIGYIQSHNLLLRLVFVDRVVIAPRPENISRHAHFFSTPRKIGWSQEGRRVRKSVNCAYCDQVQTESVD